MSMPLLVLAFFSLAILYLITFIISTVRLCKFPNFSFDSKISKVFYIVLFVICLSRACFFGVASFIYAGKNPESDPVLHNNANDTNAEDQSTQGGIETSPKLLVLLIVSPEYLVIFAQTIAKINNAIQNLYLTLFWQLLSIYYDGHANLFKSVFSGTGKYFIAIIGITLLMTQTLMVFLYLTSSLQAYVFTYQLLILNFSAPGAVFIIMLIVAFKFSGSPLRSAIYSQKLKLLQVAVFVWSIARILRAIGGLYESKSFYGMILEPITSDNVNYLAPMMLIVAFLVIEIAPFMLVLDWHFMEILILKAFPTSMTEPLYEHQGYGNLSYLSMASAQYQGKEKDQ